MTNTIKALLVVGGIVVIFGVIYFLFINEDPADIVNSDTNNAEQTESALDSMLPKNDQQGEDEEPVQVETESDEDSQADKDNPQDLPSSPGLYTSYDPEKLTDDTNILFFHAGWCPTCKVLDSDLEENRSKIPSDVRILKLNYDTEDDLKDKYGVTYQHTLVVVDKQGNYIKDFYGSNSLEELLEEI